MKTTKQLTPEQQNELSRKLQTEVDQWVNRSFNFIQLNVIETMARAENQELFELIDGADYDTEEGAEDYMNNYSLDKEFKKWLKTNKGASKLDFLQAEHNNAFEDWKSEQNNDNYPMWNTLFEFRHEAHESEIEAAKKAGLGVINAFGDFNTILFARSAGHSFYSAYWIPMYLNWNERAAKDYEGVKYDDL